METKWTPGPWRVGKGGPNLCPTVGTHKGLMVAMVAHGNDHPTQPNANLIAAAPDLYEALDNLRFQYLLFVDPETDDIARAMVDVVDAALAKARGEV